MLYKNAGVDIDILNLVKKDIGREVARTFLPGKKMVYGLFGGMYPFNDGYLVGSTDSVGTKILVACGMGVHDTVGQDIVNHCVNDILTTGALPMFFMDYIGFSQIDKNVLVKIVRGIAQACRKQKIVLIGGETAQLTRFYPKGIYDLVGFICGEVKKKNHIDPKRIAVGDIMLGLASTGLHTNGYSLARKVLLQKYTFSSFIPELKCTVGEELLKIHRSYRKELEPRLSYCCGLAHITGGGFFDNIKRILPDGTSAVVRKKTWKPYPVFKLIQKMGKVPDEEMYRIFNMGIGMVVMTKPVDVRHFRPLKPVVIGEIVKGDGSVRVE